MNPRPRRGEMWTCNCGAKNEPGRTTCVNAANHRDGPKPRGPLAVPPPTEPDPPTKRPKR